MTRQPSRWRIRVQGAPEAFAGEARLARSMWQRMVGLLNRSSLGRGEALILPHCRSVHTCFMRFPIDVVLVDGGWRVVAVYPDLLPWRMIPYVWTAKAVIELPSGAASQAQVAPGAQLVVEPATPQNS